MGGFISGCHFWFVFILVMNSHSSILGQLNEATTVVSLSEEAGENNTTSEPNNITSGIQAKPIVRIKPFFHDNPKYLFNGTKIYVECEFLDKTRGVNTSHGILLVRPQAEDIRYEYVDMRINHLYMTKIYRRTKYISFQADKDMENLKILCLTHSENKMDCPLDQIDCTIAGPFTIAYKPLEYVPKLKYKNNRFTTDTSVFTCRAHVNTTHKLVWYVPGVSLKEGVDYTSIKDENGYELSKLTFNGMRRDQDGIIITCFNIEAGSTEHGTTCANDGIALCKQTKPITIRYGPSPPEMVSYFHKEPNIAYLGRGLTFTCRASVGDYPGARLVWVIFNRKVFGFYKRYNMPDKEPLVYGVELSKVSKEKDVDNATFVHESNMTILEMTNKHEGLEIACFSMVDSRQVLKMCSKKYMFCKKSAPISVQEHKEGGETDDGIGLGNKTETEKKDEKDNEEESDSAMQIVIGVIGAILLLGLVYYMCFKKNKRESPKNSFRSEKGSQKSQESVPVPVQPVEPDSPPIGVTIYREEFGPDGKLHRYAETPV